MTSRTVRRLVKTPTRTRQTRANRRVFVIHGRDEQVRKPIFEFLRSLDLRPLEWEAAVATTRNASPPLFTVVKTALAQTQAVVALLTPDDIVRLHPSLREEQESTVETAETLQPRPNVLLELGMSLMACAERTVILELGSLRPVADLGGLNVIRFDGSDVALGKLVHRLRIAGCPVDDSGSDWRSPTRFAHLDAYNRAP